MPAKLKTPGQNLNADLTEKLFDVAHAVALDLAAMNIQRSRDHAIPSYTEWRKICNMSKVNTFDDLRNDISDQKIREKLKRLYGSVHNIDVWVGGILEDQVPGGKVGPLFQCLLVEQFRRLKSGDRLWYENPKVFTPDQLKQIKQTTLSRVLCDNGDNIDTVTTNVFILPEQQEGLIDCEYIPKINLQHWADCNDCDGGFCSAVSNFNTRTRRQAFNKIEEYENREMNENSFTKSLEEMKQTMNEMKHRIEKLEQNCDIKS